MGMFRKASSEGRSCKPDCVSQRLASTIREAPPSLPGSQILLLPCQASVMGLSPWPVASEGPSLGTAAPGGRRDGAQEEKGDGERARKRPGLVQLCHELTV